MNKRAKDHDRRKAHEGNKLQIDEYGPDLARIRDQREAAGPDRGKVFEGTADDPRLAPHAREYVVSKEGDRHEKRNQERPAQ